MNKVKILGVRIDDISLSEAVEQVKGWLEKSGKHYIVTPNPEFLVAAQNDTHFKEVLNKADLAIPDGAGLKLSGKIKHTVSGTDLMEELIQLSSEKGYTIGLLGGREGVAERLAECLRRQYQNISVTFAKSGGPIDKEGKSEATTNYELPTTDLLFVAFGPPKQEKWIANNLDKMPAKVAMGVGGAFDYLSGDVPRAPEWLRSLGFEWFFRLMVQPWRIKRQLALIKYIWLLQQSN